MNNPLEDGEDIMLSRVLVNTKKQVHELVQRKSLLRTRCKSQGKCCKMFIDNGSDNHLVSTEMVEKLGLKNMKHPARLKKCPGYIKEISSW